MIAACLLADSPCRLEEAPDLADVRTICTVIESLGARVERDKDALIVTPPETLATEAPYEFVRRMRASFLVMGPMLARRGRATVSVPGGCNIGARPVDLHLKGFQLMGSAIRHGYGCITAVTEQLVGARIYLDFPSVGATENIMMAATLAKGITVIENAAEEPEVVDLANFLNAMGAKVKGAGTKVIRIQGVDRLEGTTYAIIPDRIEAGTYLTAAAITGGDVLVENVICDHVKSVVAKLKEAGAKIHSEGDGLRISCVNGIKPVDLKTMPYPGFPTDMQPQQMALLTLAGGASMITETVFENRYLHINELKRMGAKIKVVGRSAIVQGVPELYGTPVKATDLRAGAALVLAGLAARGETEVGQLEHIDRGYYRLEEKLQALGAKITRVK
jgi:UDP-N-acetylglucosamine 1-carboxyvinyltransferase